MEHRDIAKFERETGLNVLFCTITELGAKLPINFWALSKHSIQKLIDEMEYNYSTHVRNIIGTPFNVGILKDDTNRILEEVKALGEQMQVLQDEKKTCGNDADAVARKKDIADAIRSITAKLADHKKTLNQNEDTLKSNMLALDNGLSFMPYYNDVILSLKKYRDATDEA